MERHFNHLLLIGILLLGLVARLWRVSAPLADWHSWRQVDTAGVTRVYLEEGIDLLHPRYMDISSIPSGLENPQGWRMVEFPFINGLVAGLIKVVTSQTGVEWDLVVFERLVSIMFSLGSTVFLFLIVSLILSPSVGLWSALVFALLPFNLYYSRSVLPEPKLVFFSLAAVYFWLKFIRRWSWFHWAAGVAAAAAATLLKPIWLIVYLPGLAIYAWRQLRGELLKLRWGFMLALAGVFSLLPFLLWRAWIAQFPAGIPAYDWLLNAGGIRLRPAWWRWLFAERLGRLVLGYWGLVPFGLGLILKPAKNEAWFFHGWLLGAFSYLVVLASGNVTHDYYQVILVPVVAVFVAKGLDFLLSPPKRYFSSLITHCFWLIVSCFALAFSWFHVRDFFNINHPEIVAAGQAADRVLPPDAQVIAPYGGDTAFLYQTNRKGWPQGGSIENKISRGATHFISVKFDEETRRLIDHCQLILKTEKYVIVDLRQCNLPITNYRLRT